MRASSWLTIAYVVDTVDGGGFRYSLGMSRNVDSLESATGAIDLLAAAKDKVIYRQTLKFVLAEEKLIVEDPPFSIKKSIENPRPSFSMQRMDGGVLIRGPKGEVPSLRLLNGTSVSGKVPVSAGVYFISIEKGSWHRIFVQDYSFLFPFLFYRLRASFKSWFFYTSLAGGFSYRKGCNVFAEDVW